MKTVLHFIALSVFLCFTSQLFAQVPQKMSYQAVARDASGIPITNHTIGIKFTVRESSASGPDLFSETQTALTNSLGTFSVEIGGGTATLGSFNGIPWGNGPKFLNIKIDPAGGTSYTDMGSYQLLSVAYAQYAKDVLNNDDNDANPNNEIQSLSISGDQLSISSGNTVTLPSSGGGSMSGTANQVVKFTSATAGGNSQIFDDGNFVGIGATSAIAGGVDRFRLNFAPNNNWAGMNISSTAATGKPFVSFGNNNANLGWIYYDGLDANKFKISMGGYDKFTLMQDGKLGLGTAAPNSALNLSTGAIDAYIKLNNTSSGESFTDGMLLGMRFDGEGYIWNYENKPIYFGTNAASRMVITAEGKLNVGNLFANAGHLNVENDGGGLAYPTAHLKNINAGGVSLFAENNSTDATAVFTNARGAAASTTAILAKFFDGGAGDLIRLDNFYGDEGRIVLYGGATGTSAGGFLFGSNNWGLGMGKISSGSGVANIIANADIDVSSNAMFVPWVSGTTLLGSSSYKWSAVWATNGAIQTSDERDKEDIQSLEYGISSVMKLKPVSFRWKNEKNRLGTGTNLGFVAQELEQVIPDAVVHSYASAEEIQKAAEAGRGQIESDSYGVKYSEIIPVLVKAMQEQQVLIEQLQDKQAVIERLEKEINELKNSK